MGRDLVKSEFNMLRFDFKSAHAKHRAEADWTNKLMPETLSDTVKQQQCQVPNGRRHTEAMMTRALCIGGEECGNVVSAARGPGAIIQNKSRADTPSRYWLPHILSVFLTPGCGSDYFLSACYIPRRLLDLL